MPEQFLNHAEIGATLQEVRGERMAERVWTDAPLGGEAPDVQTQQAVDAPARQPRAAIVDEERIARRPRARAPHAAICGRTAPLRVLRSAFRSSFRGFH